MCVALLKLPDGVVTRRQLRNCYQNNPDGAGLMYVADGKLNVDKGYFGFRKFYKRFRILERAHPESAFVLHFRVATSGTVSKECCHPFNINKNLAFVHNGIFTGLGNPQLSDTQVFNVQVLQKLPENFIDKPEILASLDKYVNKSLSKLILLNNKQEYVIIGESSGEWENKVWYSNSGYKYGVQKIAGFTVNDYCNWNGKSYYDSLDDTYRKCGWCNTYRPLSKMTWKNNNSEAVKSSQGKSADWMCDYCAARGYQKPLGMSSWFKQEFIGLQQQCKACKEVYDVDDGVELSSGTFYCNGCWFAVKSSYNILCPYCNTYITLGGDNSCEFCGQEISIEDYAPQLADACNFEED
jgi:hypothetical protein